eukprot:4695319-Amphidinium_carterae.1
MLVGRQTHLPLRALGPAASKHLITTLPVENGPTSAHVTIAPSLRSGEGKVETVECEALIALNKDGLSGCGLYEQPPTQLNSRWAFGSIHLPSDYPVCV